MWLVDLDLGASPQYAAISNRPSLYGRLGGAAGGSPDGSIFYTIRPPAREPDGSLTPDARYLVGHPVGGANFWVTRFRSERLHPGQTVHITPSPAYWNVLRRHADLVIIDRDILSPDEREIGNAQVKLTMVGGKVVYERHDKP